MKFPYAMLLDFVRTELNAEEIGDLLTMAGFELEGIEEVEGDAVLDIKVVSNRGDGLSVRGLSREVLAKDPNASPTDLYNRAAARFVGEDRRELELNDDVAKIEAEECNRFAMRAVDGVPGSAQSPEWMQKRLRQAGMRPISLLVDLTNYIMLELGQPLHAFDRDKLTEGRIVVRRARPGEKLTTLNGVEHELSDFMLMICDAAQPVGVAGVMGGLDTEVTDATTHLLLESAHFRNTSVRKTRKALGLNTEASYRFERSVDPEGVVAAIRRFSELLVESVPEAKFSNVVDHYPNPPQPAPIRLRVPRASKLLGMEITDEQAVSYLERLGFDVRPSEGAYEVTPPTWRTDVVREEDLVEELGRVHGYERIPDWFPHGSTTGGGARGEYYAIDRLREAVVRAGFIQMVSHSLRDFHPLDGSPNHRLGPRVIASPEHAILRDSLLPSLADAAQRNGARNLNLFEIGQVFFGSEENGYFERRKLALLSTGELLPSDRKGVESRSADFFSLKGALETALTSVNVTLDFRPESNDARFHPTRQATLVVGGRMVGVMGQINPVLAESLRLPAATFLAELDVKDSLAGAGEPKWHTVSRNPAVRRDMAVLVDKSVPYIDLAKAIEAACGEVLERQWLFDVFAGAGIPEGKHSLGIGLQLRKAGENFTDEEANQVRDRAVAALAPFGATTR